MATAARGMLCAAWPTTPSGARVSCRRQPSCRDVSSGASAGREELRLRGAAEAGGRWAAAAGAIGVVPRARGGAAAAPDAAEAEAQDAAGPASRRQGQELPLRLRLRGRRRDAEGRARVRQEDAEQGAGERGRAAEPVAAARHGVGRVERGGPRGGRCGALRQGRQAAAAAVSRPVGLRPALLPVLLGEFGPEGEGDGSGVPELLPVSPVLFSCRPCGLFFLLLRRSKHGQGRQGGSGCSRRTTGLAALHAVLADDVATPDHSLSLPTLVHFSIARQ